MSDDTPVKEPVITLSAGPVGVYPRVLRAMAMPVQYDFDPYFQQFYEDVGKKVSRALRIDDSPLILQCEPAPGIEASAASLISKGDVVLNLVSGVYGKGFGYWSDRYNKELIEIEVPYNAAIDPQQVEDAFRQRPDISIVSVVHHDTPSGTINPLREIGEIVRRNDGLLIVDAVSSWGGMDIHPGDCHADIFITGPSKCLGGAPGLTIIAVSDRAWAHIESNPDAPFASILSLKDWRYACDRDQAFPFTPSVAEINGLDAAIVNYLEEGPENVWARHSLTAKACRAGIRAMGCELWAESESIASDTTTAVSVPAGVEDEQLRMAVRRIFGVVFSSGRGETNGKLIRIGHMGQVAQPIYSLVAITALGGALNHLGVKVDTNAGIDAAMSVITADAA
ncbi:MAG: alanine--glyoxylate aminotransferase family protein [Proteobacteria bacterium]|nr:alanine--glyoxylate aminotransferase family protein [Pseudomonadota bacterium]MBT6350213.1 alanine--glyoxylate aminotransferase family protein [Pseudomonadota bacterium]|tara:strand:- start:679 stop:1863 length:1185 start_codon:yes stop_codon:yes gene_type:complete